MSFRQPDAPVRRIGPHLPLSAGLLKAAERAHEIGATAVQIFTDNPTAWRRRSEPPAELAAFKQRLADYDIRPIAIHAPYLINLCGSKQDFWEQSCTTLANELRVGQSYGAAFVVAHIGSHRGHTREVGIERLALALLRVLDEAPQEGPRLVLENSAGTGDGVGSTIEDLADIAEAAQRAGVSEQRFGFCLDTAHLWGAGFSLDEPAGTDDVVQRVESLLGPGRVLVLHLNDSRTTRGSRLDRHEHIGAGQIGYAGLRQLLCHPWFAALPTYLETPGMDTGYDAVNLERVRLIVAGEPLPDLPPEAFNQRGSRSRTAPAER